MTSALPDTGGTWEDVYEPLLQPLSVRYWQITDALVRDYLDANGNPRNLADSSVGLGSQGVFTPFAADGTLRQDLIDAGWVYLGELKEKSVKITPEVTVKETPTAQSVRTTRNVFTKLDDKLELTMVEAGPVMDAMRYELSLNDLGTSTIPALGTAGYQVLRPTTDQVVERQVIVLGVDGGYSRAEVFPRVATDKKGATPLDRDETEEYPWTASVLPDPYTKAAMWICRGGKAWTALGDSSFDNTAPVATAATGTKATIAFTTPAGVKSPTYTVTQQTGGTGSFTSSTLSGTPSVSGGTTTLTVSGLTASSTYIFKVTATGSNATVVSPPSNSITATA